MNERDVLQLIQSRLSARFKVLRIVLFGSRAKKPVGSQSDWDVLVIAESDLPFIERQGLALLALGKRDFPVDLLVYTPDEAAQAAKIPGSAVYWAEREGREFFAH